jgi:hypothetical protein
MLDHFRQRELKNLQGVPGKEAQVCVHISTAFDDSIFGRPEMRNKPWPQRNKLLIRYIVIGVDTRLKSSKTNTTQEQSELQNITRTTISEAERFKRVSLLFCSIFLMNLCNSLYIGKSTRYSKLDHQFC